MSASVAITMAGRGQRFRDAGYDRPKYEIEVHGRTLFVWALLSLGSWVEAGAEFVFVARREDDAAAFVARECAALGIAGHRLVELDATTDGQATTALLAGEVLADRALPFLVYNIDTHVRPGALRREDARGEGWLPCFRAKGDHWSFAAAGPDGRVTAVAEKRRISDHATVGLYWFGSFELYDELYGQHYGGGGALDASGERYVAPMYASLVQAGRAVFLGELAPETVVPLGTPHEVSRFAASSVRPAGASSRDAAT